jgi:hypothetical protein
VVTASQKTRNGGNPQGYGPLATLAAGNWKVNMGVHGNGTIVLQNAAGTVLATGLQARITLASATAVQFVVTSSNLDAITGSGGTVTEDVDFANYRGSGTA